jgi:hypothetical protein
MIRINLNNNISGDTFIRNLRERINNQPCENWAVDKDGDFTMIDINGQRAWFSVRNVENNNVVLGIVGQEMPKMSVKTYARYHACFMEFLLRLFDEDIVSCQITSKGELGTDFF